jgi:hypothetical protein
MATKTEMLPTIRDPAEAWRVIQDHKQKGDLVFAEKDDLRKHRLFFPEIVVIHATPDDFHNISGNFMPKRHHMDRCAEASGVTFLENNCTVETRVIDGDKIYIGHAQGQKRLPDGQFRKSSVSNYEFNPKKRAEEDIIRDTKGKYSGPNGEKEKKLLLLTYEKFGMARADTGARLRVIRELAGMPISFKPNEIQKAMVFCRIAVDTDEMLEHPELREAAIGLATGAARSIYGPTQQTSNYQINGKEPDQIEAPEGEDEEVPFNAPTQKTPEQEEIDFRIKELTYYSKAPHLRQDARECADEELAKQTHDLEALIALIKRIREWLNDPRVIAKYGQYPDYKGAA